MSEDGRTGDPRVADGRLEDEEAHLAALLAVLALTRAATGPDGATRHASALQQWRARRLAVLAGERGTSARSSALPRRAGQCR